jgi:Zn-dependent peptidase ImmA (M78 family)
VKIPKKIKLMGQTIQVKLDSEAVFNDDAFGLADYNHNKIVLQPNANGVPRTEEQIGHTYCHELLHFIFHALGEKELAKNEKVVDSVAGLLFQAIESAEYEKTK